MHILRYSMEALFLGTDVFVGALLLSAFRSGDRDLFLLLECAALLVYGFANRMVVRLPERRGEPQWATILHIATMLLLPIGVFVSYLAAGTKGDEILTLIIFAVLPVITIYGLVAIGREPVASGPVSAGYRLMIRFFFIFSFAFFGVIFRGTGGYLLLELTRDLVQPDAVVPFWPFALAFSLLFAVMVYYPVHARLLRFGLVKDISGFSKYLGWLLIAGNGFLLLLGVY